ncbi:unnamed protein product [Chondrus crispus]|uniref:Uncharacterized protein n=1 Tax=Chondrus crispus TaxID=2769 RepID=R7QSH8_CHOCR|nr:unnamed protein product [Chondrus crispus]XP_005712583.1 unnamed protein product [Chondrus crispus]CDF32782.1 unnamed protein product [Chondrus crispus]CDF41074.1 unnamed protein product [Chondrus crispus]|eukprot:XP_005711368.1 unnamed protein product [Chondrus crispus]
MLQSAERRFTKLGCEFKRRGFSKAQYRHRDEWRPGSRPAKFQTMLKSKQV